MSAKPWTVDVDVFDEEGDIQACVYDEGITWMATIDTDVNCYKGDAVWDAARKTEAFAVAQRMASVPVLEARIQELKAQLAEARKTALELERHAAHEGSIPRVKWTGPDGRVRSLLTSTPIETREALAWARDAALEEAAKVAEQWSPFQSGHDNAGESIRALKSAPTVDGGEENT